MNEVPGLVMVWSRRLCARGPWLGLSNATKVGTYIERLLKPNRGGSSMRKELLAAGARFGSLLTIALVVVAGGTAALAHGILESAKPEPDSTASAPPRVVTTTLSEDPVPDGRYIVRDGCGRVVSKGFTVDEDTISAPTPDGQPGRWQVRFDFISSEDGHRYNETYSFSVKGKKDCSAPEEPVEENGDDGDESSGSASSTNSSGSSGSSQEAAGGSAQGPATGPQVPVVPLTIASAAAIGLAVLGRRNPTTT